MLTVCKVYSEYPRIMVPGQLGYMSVMSYRTYVDSRLPVIT